MLASTPRLNLPALPYAARGLNNCCTRSKAIIVQANTQFRCYKEKRDDRRDSTRADALRYTWASNLTQ